MKEDVLKYLTYTEQDMTWGGVVSFVETQDVAPGQSYPPGDHPKRYLFSTETGRVLNEFQMVYITSGSGMFRSKSFNDGRLTRISEGDMLVLFPGEWHSYYPEKATGWKEYGIGFAGKMAASLLKYGFISPTKPILHIGVREEITRLYETALNIASEQKSLYQQLLFSMVNLIIGYSCFYDRNGTFSTTYMEKKINQAKLLIPDNLGTITPESLSAKLNLGYTTFRKKFKEYTGFSPAKYILEIRIMKAKELLTNTYMTVNEIASELGFDNIDYFYVVFKSRTGMTPLSFRKKSQGSFNLNK